MLTNIRGLAQASLQLDLATLTLPHMRLRRRLQLLSGKWFHLPKVLARRHARLRIGPVRYHAGSISELGTLQSSINDVYRDLVAPGVLDPQGRPTVVDVGANVGQFALAVTLACPGSRLLCLEPDPITHARLRRNMATVDHVTTMCVAAGDKSGSRTLYRHDLSVMSSLCPGGRPGFDSANTVQVNVTTLDEVLADLPSIDLLKIDVEGAEADVLQGAAETLRRTRFLLLELVLDRDNLATLNLVRQAAPQAALIRFGRPLGPHHAPDAQDVLIRLRDL